MIKTGVRMINLSYSRISLMDVAQKLLLDSPEDAEFIVAKVIQCVNKPQNFYQVEKALNRRTLVETVFISKSKYIVSFMW